MAVRPQSPPRTPSPDIRRRWPAPTACAFFLLLLASAGPAEAALKDLANSVTLTRAGANSTTATYPDPRLERSDFYNNSYNFSSTAAGCKSLSNIEGRSWTTMSNPALGTDASVTFTGQAGKYFCYHVSDGVIDDYFANGGPISYSGPTLTLNSAGADNKYVTGDHIEVTAAFGYNVDVDTTGARRASVSPSAATPATRPTTAAPARPT